MTKKRRVALIEPHLIKEMQRLGIIEAGKDGRMLGLSEFTNSALLRELRRVRK
jgi:hypothetical protein